MALLHKEQKNSAKLTIKDGWLQNVEIQRSSHCQPRDENDEISLLVVHNISLPPGKFGGAHITNFFLGRLDPSLDPYFADIYQMRVSAHCLIQRDGHIVQYVSFNDKAWHAGVSQYQGREKCNDFSIGIELEGTDDIPYTTAQYQQLSCLSAALIGVYPKLKHHIVGHSDIAPGRKTDPGVAFDWQRYKAMLASGQ
ncbi:AmpD protein [Colwellia chukchiensis]|uniref:1,6-anhydro-N-acetylmuramyl-L-alanine amidase AmpD n=1 Tax=Colwellia chukchiensis TaxID=641665 RepID=A0A1H7L2A0_9GAMM|nr:1,6-anhydro-N-acetylmuramyl-L-alanine amidase AmpD [Colwellia chukchiensis]SEK93118.1 AmpD protein [Colwellia chukchiensis]